MGPTRTRDGCSRKAEWGQEDSQFVDKVGRKAECGTSLWDAESGGYAVKRGGRGSDIVEVGNGAHPNL